MDRFAILFGVLLCGLGLVGYYSPDTLGKSDARSPTALIPACLLYTSDAADILRV